MSYNYVSLEKHPGIYKHKVSGNYLAQKKIDRKTYRKTFKSLSEAKKWKKLFNGIDTVDEQAKTATLGDVWTTMQENHFPTLAESTRRIWIRRFTLFKDLECVHMENLTPSRVTSWVENKVKIYKQADHSSSRGRARRCNLDNELNLIKTIFNWYKDSEHFEYEAKGLICPIKPRHKKLGFIRAREVKNMKISLEHALEFFSSLDLFYRDFASFQYYTASRVGEIAGLQWSRIDFKNRRVTIMETAQWNDSKVFEVLKPFPKNREPRQAYMTDELKEVLERRLLAKIEGNDFVFHVDGKPLNYGTIQANYKKAQRKANIPYSGTHILRHGMATLARKVGGGLDAVVAMTGHKDFKLADHYSKLDDDFQKEISIKIMEHINSNIPKPKDEATQSNVIQFSGYKKIN